MSENALGGATDSSDGEGNSPSVECPTCGRSNFKSRVGLGMHRRRSHGEDTSTYPKLDDPDWLYERYWDDYMSQTEIAELVGCTNHTVSDYLNKHGIETRKGKRGNVLDTSLTAAELSFIKGELLGDGCIYTRHENSTVAMYIHGTSRENYRDWLADWLRERGMDVSTNDRTNDGNYGNGNMAYILTTKGYRCLYQLWQKWYPSGEKRVPKNITLTPEMLRQWYIGDGSKLQTSKAIRLHTQGFTQTGLKRLILAFEWRGIEARVREGKGFLYIPAGYSDRFFEFMAPLPPELESVYGYKWD